MASITEISVEHIHNAYESIRGNIAVEAFYAVVTGFMAVTLIHRLYTVYTGRCSPTRTARPP